MASSVKGSKEIMPELFPFSLYPFPLIICKIGDRRTYLMEGTGLTTVDLS